MNEAVQSMIQAMPVYVGYGFGLGVILLVVSWAIGKVWSVIHIAD